MPNPTIRFTRRTKEENPSNHRLFVESSRKGDFGAFSFKLEIPSGADFDHNNQLEKILKGENTCQEGNGNCLILPDYYKNVQIVLDIELGEFLFNAKKTDEKMSFKFGVPSVHNSCGIDGSDDPGCRFLYGRSSCDSSNGQTLEIDPGVDEIKGKIEVDLFVEDKSRDNENTFKVIVTPYENKKYGTPKKIGLKKIKGSEFGSVASGKLDVEHKFTDELIFAHEKDKRAICYLIEIVWYDMDGEVNSSRTGDGEEYTNNLKFTIGDKVNHLPEIAGLKYHIAWTPPNTNQ